MTETIAPTPGTDPADTVEVHLEDDATPIARLVARTLRDSIDAGRADALRGLDVAVTVQSHDTPQVATVAISGPSITVSTGAPAAPDAVVVVDLNGRFALAGEPSGDQAAAAAVIDALHPPIPGWREAADSFWAATHSLRGMPDTLIVIAAEGDDDVEQHVLGNGETQYLIASSPDVLAGIFTGADDLMAAMETGAVGVRGTLCQLSVMTGASWKVRYDV